MIVLFHLAGIEKVPVVSNTIQLASEIGVIQGYVFGLHNGVPLFAFVVQSSALIINVYGTLELLYRVTEPIEVWPVSAKMLVLMGVTESSNLSRLAAKTLEIRDQKMIQERRIFCIVFFYYA